MARPTEDQDGSKVRRSLSLPRSVDSGINDYAKSVDDTRSGVIVRLWHFFYEHNKTTIIQKGNTNNGTQN